MTKKHISNKELLFFGSYITYLVYYLMKQTAFTRGMPGFLDKLIPVICIAFLVLYEFYFGRMTHIECLELGVIACLALIQTKNSVGMTRNSFILLLILIFFSKGMDFKKIAWVTVVVSTTILISIYLCATFFEIIPNYLVGSDRGLRQSIGFSYPLFPASIYFNVVVMYCVLREKKITWLELILMAYFNHRLYDLTKSRLSFYMTILVIAFVFIYKYFWKIIDSLVERSRFFRIIICNSYGLAFLASMAVVFLYMKNDTGIMERLNSILSDRLYNSRLSIQTYGFSLFGQRITWVGGAFNQDGLQIIGDYLYVDNLYLQVLQQYGIVFAILLLLIVTSSIYALVRRKQFFMAYMMAIIAIRCMIDDANYNLHYNGMLLLTYMGIAELENVHRIGGFVLKEVKNRVIYIRELLKYLLSKAVLILLGAVIMALLLGGYKYLKDKKAADNNTTAPAVVTEDVYANQLSAVETSAVQLTAGYYQKYIFYENYLKESLRLNMDPNNVKKCFLYIYVDSDYRFNYTKDNENDYTESLSIMYSQAFKSADFVKKLIDDCNIDAKEMYVKEIISTEYRKNIVTVQILVPDSVDEKQLLKSAEDFANGLCRSYQEYGEHSIKLSNDNIVTYDRETEELIYDVRKLVSDFSIQYHTAKASLSNTQLKALKELTRKEEALVAERTNAEPVKVSISKKYVILGFILGMGMVIVGCICIYCSSSKLKYYRDITDMYGVKVIKAIDDDASIKDLKERIKFYCDGKYNRVYICGSSGIDEKLINALDMKESGIELRIGESLVSSIASLKQCMEHEATILVEKIGISKYDDIREELATIEENNINLLGCVVTK